MKIINQEKWKDSIYCEICDKVFKKIKGIGKHHWYISIF